jgi:hypothetical protein
MSVVVVCGSTAASACKNDPVREADPNQLHEVRCCSDTSLGNGWKQHANCQAAGFGTWGESDISGVCNRAKTYNEAVDICEAVGARLCTEEELLADCARGTGCGFDREYNWSSSTYTASIGEQPLAIVVPDSTNTPTLSPNACTLPTKPIWLAIGTNGQACDELRTIGINDELTFLFYSEELTVQNALDDFRKIEVEYKVLGDSRTKWKIESDFFNGENQRPYATTGPDGVLRFSQTMFVNQLEGVEAGVWLEWKWKVELNSGLKVEYRSSTNGSGGVIYVQ